MRAVQLPQRRDFIHERWYQTEACMITFSLLLISGFLAFDNWYWSSQLEESLEEPLENSQPKQAKKTSRLRFAKPHVAPKEI